MANATVFDSTPTNPGGTGSTITVTLPTHAVGDVIYICIGNTGNTLWTGNPAGWTRLSQQQVGTAANGLIGTWFFHRVVSGDTIPLTNPTFTLGATVTREAFARSIRGSDVEGPFTLSEWGARAYNTGTSNPIRPISVTTPAPEMLVLVDYFQRSATNAPDQSGYTQDEEIVISGTLVGNATQKVNADQRTVLSNQDASPTSGVRWVAGIICVPSPDYVYYRAGTQAFNSNATNVTPTLPTGTSASDNRSNKDLIILTAQCAGATPTLNAGGDWTEIPTFSTQTGGAGATTTRKWWTLYDGSLASQVNRTPSGEIFAYLSTYRNPDQVTPIGNTAAQSNASSTSGTWPALTRSSTKSTVQLTCIADATPTFTTPSPWTERNDSQGVVCADQVFDALTTVNSGSFTLSSASPNVGGMVEIRSVSSVGSLSPSASRSPSASVSPSSSASASVSPSASISPSASASASLSPSASRSPSSSASPSEPPFEFPATGILDDFNRANETPIDNGTWGAQLFAGDGDIQLTSNQANGTGSGSGNDHGWLTQYGPDCEVYLEIVNLDGEDSVQIFARLSQIGGTFDGYSVRARGGTINNLIVLRWDDGIIGAGLVTLPQTVSDGDWFGMRLTGDLIEVFYKDVSESPDWFLLGDVTDATYTAAGHPALYVFSHTNIVDNFGGGTIGEIILGTVTWGHQTGVAEQNVRTFADHWTGNGTIEGTDDDETINLEAGQNMVSEVVETGPRFVRLLQNHYRSSDDVTLEYRTGGSEAECLAASFTTYTGVFASAGFVQVKLVAE